MLRLLLLVLVLGSTAQVAHANEPWEQVLHEPMPQPVRPPAWLRPYLKDRYRGKHNNLPVLLDAVHKDKWVTGEAAYEAWTGAYEARTSKPSGLTKSEFLHMIALGAECCALLACPAALPSNLQSLCTPWE